MSASRMMSSLASFEKTAGDASQLTRLSQMPQRLLKLISELVNRNEFTGDLEEVGLLQRVEFIRRKEYLACRPKGGGCGGTGEYEWGPHGRLSEYKLTKNKTI